MARLTNAGNWVIPLATLAVPMFMVIKLSFAPDDQVPNAITGGVAAPSNVAGVPSPLNTTVTL